MQLTVCTAIHTYQPGSSGVVIFDATEKLMSLLISSLAAVVVEQTVFPVASSTGTEDGLIQVLGGVEELLEQLGVCAPEQAPDVPEPSAHIVVSHTVTIPCLSRL